MEIKIFSETDQFFVRRRYMYLVHTFIHIHVFCKKLAIKYDARFRYVSTGWTQKHFLKTSVLFIRNF